MWALNLNLKVLLKSSVVDWLWDSAQNIMKLSCVACHVHWCWQKLKGSRTHTQCTESWGTNRSPKLNFAPGSLEVQTRPYIIFLVYVVSCILSLPRLPGCCECAHTKQSHNRNVFISSQGLRCTCISDMFLLAGVQHTSNTHYFIIILYILSLWLIVFRRRIREKGCLTFSQLIYCTARPARSLPQIERSASTV